MATKVLKRAKALTRSATRTAKRARAGALLGGASAAAIAMSAGSAHAQTATLAESIVKAGDKTTVIINGSNATVTTTNVAADKKVAFNRFEKFTVPDANSVTLLLPNGTFNLVNLVNDRVTVNGTVTSRLQDAAGAAGTVGGSLFFVTSGGLFVGAKGVINTGRLVVRGAGPGLPTGDDLSGLTAASVLDYGATDRIEIAGQINAPGGIDLKADSLTIAGTGRLYTGAAGLTALGTAVPGAMVSMAGLEEGTAIRKVDGRIVIVGASSVTAEAGAVLDARSGAAGTTAIGGGIDIASGGAIRLAGTLTAWDGAQGAASDITVKASKTVTVGAGFDRLGDIGAKLLQNYFTASTAATSLDIIGAITGGIVSLTSDASASTKREFKPLDTTLDFLANFLVGKVLDKAGVAIDVMFTRADASSAVTVGSAARIKAAGDLTVAATSTAATTGEVEAELGQSGGLGLAIGLGIAQIKSAANVTIDGQLESGGALSVAASNDATGKMEVAVESTKTAKAGALAYTEAKVAAGVKVGGDAKLTGGTVSVTAINAQAATDTPGAEETGFDTIALVNASDGSAGGGAAAVTKLDIAAKVDVAGAIRTTGTAGTVTVRAETNTNHVNNAAKTDTDDGTAAEDAATEDLKSIQAGDRQKLMKASLAEFADVFEKIVLGEPGDAAAGDDGGSARFGAAAGVLVNSQRANVSMTGTIVATGDVAVDALVKDASVRNQVKAATASVADDGGTTAIAGAAAWSKSDYVSQATVGGTVTAAGLAVNAKTDRPRGTEFDLELNADHPRSDVTEFAQEPLKKLSEKLALTTGYFGNSAGAAATTDGETETAISGSVSYNHLTADTRAWIDPNTVLTLSRDLTVKADTSLVLLNLAGALPNDQGGMVATEGGNAAGAAVGFSRFDPKTVAGIGKGVVLTRATGTGAVNVDVAATAAVSAITLAPQGGKGNGKTGSGTFATNLVDGTTHATISKDARLDLGTGKLALKALTELELWTIGGSLAITQPAGDSSKTAVSVGVAGALNDVDFGTLARVVDAGGDDRDGAAAIVVALPGGITAGTADIGAATRGSINAISVAGVALKNDPSSAPAGKDSASEGGAEGAEKKKGTLGDTAAKLDQAAALLGSPLLSGAADYAALADEYTSKLEGAVAAADDKSTGTPATKGFGVAGSASVNLSDLTTRVETTGAKFTRATGGTGGFTARAVEAVDMLSITGGAAISTGKEMKDGVTLIAGAYGLSYSNNATGALLTGTAVSGFGDVAVEAAANGSRIAAGLSLGVDTSGTEKSKAAAGSVSHLVSRDAVSAGVVDGNIVGAGTGSLSILAYNGLAMGAGAGGLAWGAGKAFGGAATVIDVKGAAAADAAAARLTRTTVSQVADVSVRGLTAARIAGIAAAGVVTTGKDDSLSLTAGLSLNLISLDSSAIIDTGADGHGTIAATGAVNVFAGDLDPAHPETLASVGRSTATAGSSYLSRFALSASDFDGDDPIRTTDLKGGTQILSIAVPVSASKGNALGVGFAWNRIDNDRTAAIIGGAASAGGSTISAGRVSVQAVERSDILALGVGIGASAKGAGLMGSVSRNLIEGSSSAGIGRSTGAANNLGLTITSAPSSTPSVVVGATGEGGIFSLAGAVGVGKKAAGGVSVGVNEITRAGSAGTGGLAAPSDQAGLRATLDGVTFAGNPDVDVSADARGRIVGTALAVAGSTSSAAVAGAASVNKIAPTIQATASRLSYANASTGDLKVRGADSSSIQSNAVVLGIGGKGGVALGVSVNKIDADVSAALRTAAGDKVLVRNLLVDTASTAKTTAFSFGAGGGKSFGGAGSVVVNLTDSDVASRLDYAGGEIATTGSIGVVAKRDLTIDVGAGVVAGAAKGAALGASVIVNDLGGSADAQIVGSAGNGGTITAFTGSGDETARTLAGLRTGVLARDPAQFSDLATFKDLDLKTMIDPVTAGFKGVVVNAASTAATRTIAITGAASGPGAAVGVTAVINNTTGRTNAAIVDAKVQAGSATVAQAGVSIDVRASSQQAGLTFAGAIAGSASVGVAAPVISDGYQGSTTASVRGGSLSAADRIAVNAIAGQTSTALALAGAVGGTAGAAVAGVSPRFQAVTTATIDKPTALKALGSAGIAVNATGASRSLATFGTLAVGGTGGGAAAVVVATNSSVTKAEYKGLQSVVVDAPKVAVTADGAFEVMVAGASAAGGATFALVGNGVGVVHRGTVVAQADNLNYNRATGTVDVRAAEKVSIVPIVGQASVSVNPVSGSAALGAIAILGQSKVQALLTNPVIVADTVTVDAKGWSQVDALQLGVAVGGIGIGANVTYIGIGEVTDAGALLAPNSDTNEDSKVSASAGSSGGGNRNMQQLSAGSGKSSTDIVGSGDRTLTAAERDRAMGTDSARSAFTGAGKADAADQKGLSDARVEARVSGTGSIDARNRLAIDSDANLLSKSTNVQLSAGIAAGSATIGITRNAVQSIALLDGIDARGGTLQINATTGQARAEGAARTISTLSYAADADIKAGSVGAGALTVGVADVKLQSVAKADLNAKAGFTTVKVAADDTTVANVNAIGAAAGGVAANVVVAKAEKEGIVAAGIGHGSLVTATGALDVTATALGGASARTIAASGGILFAGNAAVAIARDARTVQAVVGERAVLSASTIAVRAASTPEVSARSIGVALSGSIAAGASVATATSTGTLTAAIGESGIASGTLTVAAESLRKSGGDNVVASAIGSAGGALAAANGSVATAKTELTTNAVLGANLEGGAGTALVQKGTLTVKANREIAQFADATGVVAAGILAIGVQRAESRSSGDTRAAIENVDGGARTAVEDVTLTSYALDHNRANVTAGAGGLGAGVAADAITVTRSTATTEMLTPGGANGIFRAGLFTARAVAESDYKATSDATLATAVGGSGTTSDNTVAQTATLNIGRAGAAAKGAGTSLYATGYELAAGNVIAGGDGGYAKGAGGGVATGQAALLRNSITQTSNVNLNDGITLRQAGGDASQNVRGTFIDAFVTQGRSHKVALDVGGVMQLPFAEIQGSYNARNNVKVGDNVLIRADMGVGIGTYAVQGFIDTAAVQIYGLAGLGGGKTTVNGSALSDITIGNATMIESLMDIRVSTGISADEVKRDTYAMNALTDTFNNTALPLKSEASASANVTANNTLTIGASTIRSARDVVVESKAATGSPSATGTGHNPYLELLSATTKGGDTSTKTDSAIRLNGTALTAGYLNDRTITIDKAEAGDVSGRFGATDVTVLNGVKVTTNNPLYYDAGDTDWLGQFTISSGSFNAKTYIDQQIVNLVASARKLGLTVPDDPASVPAANRQAARDAVNVASVKSDILAQIGTLYETRAALVQAGAGDRPSVVIGGSLDGKEIRGDSGVFAAGGRVTLGSNAVSGQGAKITTFGGPSINIVNNTDRDTVLGNMFIPFKVNGGLDFSGAAQTLGAGIDWIKPALPTETPSAAGVARDPQIIVKTGAARSDIVALGTISNIAGLFRASTAKGNYIQFGAVNVAAFSADAPNGLFTVSMPNGTFSMGLPISFYYGDPRYVSLFPITRYGSERANETANPTQAIELLASYIATKRLGIEGTAVSEDGVKDRFAGVFGFRPGDVLYEMFLQRSHRSNVAGTGNGTIYLDSGNSIFGGCLYSACEILSPDATIGDTRGVRVQSTYVYDGDSDSNTFPSSDSIHTVGVQYRSPVLLGTASNRPYPAVDAKPGETPNAITATQVIINAMYVDVSGEIKAGPVKNRSLTIRNSYTGQSGSDFATTFGAAGGAVASNYDLLRSDSGFQFGTGQNLGAQFVRTGVTTLPDGSKRAEGYIQVDDVIAGGGGSITIAGKILNTNPHGGGKLTVLNGYGTIKIDNQTGYDIRVNTINAGLSADGRITLRDTGKTTEYFNTVGGNVIKTEYTPVYTSEVDRNGLPIIGDVVKTDSDLGRAGIVGSGIGLNYDPTGGFYYVWHEKQNLQRSINTPEGVLTGGQSGPTEKYNPTTWTATPWAYDTRANPETTGLQAPTEGRFVDLSKSTSIYQPQIDAAFTRLLAARDELEDHRDGSGPFGFPGSSDQSQANAIRARIATEEAELNRLFTLDKKDLSYRDASAINKAQGSGKNDFVQIVTGQVTDSVRYYHLDTADSSDNREGFFSELPTKATIDVLSAARATYPIRIQFDQGTGIGGGAIDIKSNAGGNIDLRGALTFGGGLTSLETTRSIVVGEKAIVTSKDISLKAGEAIGTFAVASMDPTKAVAENPFQANLLGGYFSADSGKAINVLLRSGETTAAGTPAPIQIGTVRAAGDVKIVADTTVAGVANPAAGYHIRSDTGNVTLDVTGSVTGNVNYRDGSLSLTTAGLRIDTAGNSADLANLQKRGQGVVSVRASGDVAIEQVGRGGGTDRVLQIGLIETPGDVLVKAPGSIVAADATATIDQEKLALFLSAASALQLAPTCTSNCGVVDPMALGGLDRLIRDNAYAAYDRYFGAEAAAATPAEREAIRVAAEKELQDIFGSMPASREMIATRRIVLARDKQIALQLRNKGSEAYDRYALTNAAATAGDSRNVAVRQAVGVVDKLAAFGSREGLSLSADGRSVVLASLAGAGDPELPTFLPGGDLYRLAVATLEQRGTALAGSTATRAEIKAGLDLYLADLRAPAANLLPAELADLVGASGDARTAAVGRAITDRVLSDWVQAQNLVTQRQRASADALGKLEQIDLFLKKGVTVAADGRTIVLSDADFAKPTLKAGGELYELGLATLRAKVNANGLRDKVPLPTNADVVAGLNLYYTELRAPLNGLLPGTLPVLAGTTQAERLAGVSAAITADALAKWATDIQTEAVKDLKAVYAVLPVSRADLGTAALNKENLDKRTAGATWTQTMLDVQIPSTAFVPVADTQIESRNAVIAARGVSLVAGNSIGAFDGQLQFKYDKNGFAGTRDANGVTVVGDRGDKNLAAAYLASSGPGDLKTDIRYREVDGRQVVDTVTFTTRRDQPLQLTASGIVNAVAATNPGTMATTVTGPGSAVQGDIFINNNGVLHLGSVVSQKTRSGIADGCNIGTAPADKCDSRIRLVASDILGVASGAARVASGSALLSNEDGSALVMGGLVRMEAGNGSIVRAARPGETETGAIAVDAVALEVLRAAKDIKLVRRAGVEIPQAGGGYRFASAVYAPGGALADQSLSGGSFTRSAGAATPALVSNLRLGDVFAGKSLSIDNPYGGLFVIALPSNLESENRNSRLVTDILSLRAAGDIGSGTQTGAGLVGQFDIQAPLITQFMAGYDFGNQTTAMGRAPDGLGTGSGFFALRGVSQIGRTGDSAPDVPARLGARGSITIGTLNNDQDSATPIDSKVIFRGHITVGGSLNLTTDGSVDLKDQNVRITGLGIASDPGTVDLRALRLNIKGAFDYQNDRNIILGSLTAGGGTVESILGKLTVTGTLFGVGGQDSPFTMKGLKGVEIGETGSGAISLIAAEGDVRVNGLARATDFTAIGDNVYLASGLYGRSAVLQADPTGVVRIGGAVFLQRSAADPDTKSFFKLAGNALRLDDLVSAQDLVDVRGTSITLGERAMILNTGELNLIATGALSMDPGFALSNIGAATLRSGNAPAGGVTVNLASFSGGSLDILAPVGIVMGATSARGAVTFQTGGTLVLNGTVMAGGAVSADAATIRFANGAGIRDAGSVALNATQAINGTTTTLVRSRGAVTIATRDSLSLGQIQATGGSIAVSQGGLTLGGAFTSNGTDYRIQAAQGVSFAGPITAAGNYGIVAGGDLALNGAVAMTGGNGLSNLSLDAGGALTIARSASITAKAQTASVRINAGSVQMDSLAAITGAAVALTSRGTTTLGDVRASEAQAQTVSIRSTGALSVGRVTGGTTTVTASSGSVTLRGAAVVGGLTVTARDSIVTNGVQSSGATLSASLGDVVLNGTTRVLRSDSPTAARLSVTAGKGIEVTGALSATGGMSLTSNSVKTSGSGYLTDTDLAGALTTLRADQVDIRFDTGTNTGTAMRIDARGRTQSSIADARFLFATNRPITFDNLSILRGEVQASTALNVTSLTMRDYLLLGRPGATVALVGQGTAPAATRSAQTGTLSAARLVMTPAGSGTPSVSVNGTLR